MTFVRKARIFITNAVCILSFFNQALLVYLIRRACSKLAPFSPSHDGSAAIRKENARIKTIRA